MMERLLRFRLYAVALLCVVHIDLARSLSPETLLWWRAGAFAGMALITAHLALRVRGLRGKSALSDIFLWSVLASAPNLLGLLVFAAALVGRTWMASTEPRKRREAAVRSTAGLIAGGAAWGLLVGTGPELATYMIAASAVVYLALNGISESLFGRLSYWKTLLGTNIAPAFGRACLIAPAAVVLMLAAGPAPETWVWWTFTGVICAYLALDIVAGPLMTDALQQKRENTMYLRAVEALALAVEAKDNVSSGHLKRVRRYSVEVAKALNCTDEEIQALEFGALLHDIGKVAVPRDILTKPGRLSPQEFTQIASHAQIGAEILTVADFPPEVIDIVRSHHENWDGTGYPQKLKGEDIPLLARIFSVVDVYDALTSDRPYRPALKPEDAEEHIVKRREKAFDPKVTEAMMKILPTVRAQLANAPVEEAKPNPGIQARENATVEQTSLTSEERIESLKQARSAAWKPSENSQDGAWQRLVASLADTLSVKEIHDLTASLLRGRVPFDEATAFLVSEGELRTIAAYGPNKERFEDIKIAIGDGPTGWVAEQGQPLLNGNPTNEDGALGRLTKMLGMKSVLAVPLWDAGRVIGTLNLYSEKQGVYQPEHAARLSRLTRPLGRIYQRAVYQPEPIENLVDNLTGLQNARGVAAYLYTRIKAASNLKRTLGVLVVDVANFRLVNAHHGYPAGDETLMALSRTLQACIRDRDFVGRLGDDRFLIAIPDSDHDYLDELAERIQHEVHKRSDSAKYGFVAEIQVRTGSALYPADVHSAQDLLVRAHDRAFQQRLSASSVTIDLAKTISDTRVEMPLV